MHVSPRHLQLAARGDMHDDDNEAGPADAGASMWVLNAAVCCCAAILTLALCSRAAAALLRDSGSTGVDRMSPAVDWRERMRAVRFRQQLAHWAVGNSAFRAGRHSGSLLKSDPSDSMV